MFKKFLTLVITGSMLAACSSWGTSNAKPAPNDPTVGSRDSSDMLFGQAAIEPGQTPTKSASAAK